MFGFSYPGYHAPAVRRVNMVIPADFRELAAESFNPYRRTVGLLAL